MPLDGVPRHLEECITPPLPYQTQEKGVTTGDNLIECRQWGRLQTQIITTLSPVYLAVG